MERVKNVATHGVDLSDGRQLAPGEFADEVATGNTHNKALVDAGLIAVVGAAEDDAPSPDPDPDPPVPEPKTSRRPGATTASEEQ